MRPTAPGRPLTFLESARVSTEQEVSAASAKRLPGSSSTTARWHRSGWDGLRMQVLTGPVTRPLPRRTVEGVDPRTDIRNFLRSRRARLQPDQLGLRTYGDRRRVAGLRREEVAALAGISVDYYARLERGDIAGASESVLDGLARALRLDEAEHQHLLDLVRNAGPSPARRRARPRVAPPTLTPAVVSILNGLGTVPAYVATTRMDVVAANELCRALFGGVLDEERLPVNLARFTFLDPRAREFYKDWDAIADATAASLRLEVGRNPRDRATSDLIGELSTRSDEFADRWARQNVLRHRSARKVLHSSVVGDIELTGTGLELPGEDLVIVAYTADPGSAAEDKLRLLASWAATKTSTQKREGITHA